MRDLSFITLDLRMLMALGVRAFDEGNQRTAYNYFSKAVAMQPDSVDALLWKAGTSPDLEEAVRCLEEALTLDPDNVHVQDGLRWVRQRLAALRAAPPSAPLPPETRAVEARQHYCQAQLHEAQGRLDEAVLALEKVTALQPDHLEAYYFLARIRRAQGRWDEAAAAYKKVLELDPASTEALHQLGGYHERAGRLLDAIIYYQETLRSWPDDQVTRRQLEFICDALFHVLGY